MRKKLIAMMLGACMTATLFTGCGAKEEKETASDNGKGSVYYLNFKPEQDKDWQALAKEYTKETGVKVTVQTAASGTYESTLKSEMAKSDAPTLFQVNGPVELATWKDYCYDLADSALYKDLKSDDFALIGDDGKVQGIAYVIETYGLIYNKKILADYCKMDNAVVSSAEEINSFDKLKAVADDIQKRLDEINDKYGYDLQGAFTSAGMDSSSDWRFKTHLANLPIYYEYKDKEIKETDAIEGTYLDNYKNIWDLYITDATCDKALISSKTCDDATAEFAMGNVVFYQNGTWAYDGIKGNEIADEDIGMMPIYIGAPGEENQGLCTGSENYWCVNNKASEEDIQATLDFVQWAVESDKGRDSMSHDMGFVTPFKTFTGDYVANNPLITAANESIEAGKTPVSWNFSTIPSENWKNNVGNALLEYAQGTGKWDTVASAFVDGWKTEYDAAHK
nr:ABC transporter substrate-binding protein [uncultured Lachnoclostridium sp.]